MKAPAKPGLKKRCSESLPRLPRKRCKVNSHVQGVVVDVQ